MRGVLRISGLVVAVLGPAAAMVQAGQAAPASVSAETVSTCIDAQQRSLRLLDAINQRVEMSRQSNAPAEMRAAMADVQRALLEARRELDRCEALAQANAAIDLHAGHTMPSTQVPPAAPAQAADAAAPSSPATRESGSPSRDQGQGAQTRPSQPSPTGLTITFRSTPSPMRGAAENTFAVTVKDRQGKPINGADVSLLFYMPAMPSMKMPEMRNELKLKSAGNGTYTGMGQVMMAGQWTVTVSVKQNGKEIGQRKVTVAAK